MCLPLALPCCLPGQIEQRTPVALGFGGVIGPSFGTPGSNSNPMSCLLSAGSMMSLHINADVLDPSIPVQQLQEEPPEAQQTCSRAVISQRLLTLTPKGLGTARRVPQEDVDKLCGGASTKKGSAAVKVPARRDDRLHGMLPHSTSLPAVGVLASTPTRRPSCRVPACNIDSRLGDSHPRREPTVSKGTSTDVCHFNASTEATAAAAEPVTEPESMGHGSFQQSLQTAAQAMLSSSVSPPGPWPPQATGTAVEPAVNAAQSWSPTHSGTMREELLTDNLLQPACLNQDSPAATPQMGQGPWHTATQDRLGQTSWSVLRSGARRVLVSPTESPQHTPRASSTAVISPTRQEACMETSPVAVQHTPGTFAPGTPTASGQVGRSALKQPAQRVPHISFDSSPESPQTAAMKLMRSRHAQTLTACAGDSTQQDGIAGVEQQLGRMALLSPIHARKSLRAQLGSTVVLTPVRRSIRLMQQQQEDAAAPQQCKQYDDTAGATHATPGQQIMDSADSSRTEVENTAMDAAGSGVLPGQQSAARSEQHHVSVQQGKGVGGKGRARQIHTLLEVTNFSYTTNPAMALEDTLEAAARAAVL